MYKFTCVNCGKETNEVLAWVRSDGTIDFNDCSCICSCEEIGTANAEVELLDVVTLAKHYDPTILLSSIQSILPGTTEADLKFIIDFLEAKKNEHI